MSERCERLVSEISQRDGRALFQQRREQFDDSLDERVDPQHERLQWLGLKHLLFERRYRESKLHILVHFRIGGIKEEIGRAHV